jgi:hypothetical protein
MIDPQEEYIDGGKRFNFNQDQLIFLKHTDQFLPYLATSLDTEIPKIDFKSEFKGTLFRFPIRTEKSKLSAEIKPFDKIIHEDILESFYIDLNLILLFLKKVEKIEIFEILNEETTLIASTYIDFSKSSNGLKEKREKFNTKLMQAVNEDDKKMKKNAFELDDISEDFKIVIQTNIFEIDFYLKKHHKNICKS